MLAPFLASALSSTWWCSGGRVRTETPSGVNFIKLFSSSPMKRPNKLERLQWLPSPPKEAKPSLNCHAKPPRCESCGQSTAQGLSSFQIVGFNGWNQLNRKNKKKYIRQPWLPSQPTCFVLWLLLALALQSVFVVATDSINQTHKSGSTCL